MKRSFLFALVIAVLLLNSGCKKSSTVENYLKGKIDGQAFACSDITANKPEPIPGSGDDPTLRITGNFPFYSLKLMLIGEGAIKPGTYTFGANKQRSATLLYKNTDSYYAGNGGIFSTGQLYGSGSITITLITGNLVKGNFEFTAVDIVQGSSKTVTSGEFSVNRN